MSGRKPQRHGAGYGTSLRCLHGVGLAVCCFCVFVSAWPAKSAQFPEPSILPSAAADNDSDSSTLDSLGLEQTITRVFSSETDQIGQTQQTGQTGHSAPYDNRSVAQVVSCLDSQHGNSPVKPASYQAYEHHAEVARLFPLKPWYSRKPPPQQVLTVVTTLTPDRLHVLESQCSTWSGPLSAVMYVPLVSEPDQLQNPGTFSPAQLKVLQPAMDKFDQLFKRMELVTNNCVLTALLVYEFVEEDMVVQLPINSMRNQALLLAQTPLVTMLDVDLLISSRLGSALTESREAQALTDLVKDKKVFVVLPAFDPDIACARKEVQPEGSKFIWKVIAGQQKLAQYAVKGGKRTVQGLVKSNLIEPFNYQSNIEGHGETKFPLWLRCNQPTCSSYRIRPKSPRFEPWGIVDRELALMHPYDEVFRGYGKNKIANLLHLQDQGFEMRVLGWAFVVHLPHALSDIKRIWMKEVKDKQGPGVHLNSVKFDQIQSSMANKTYTPKVAAATAACIRPQLSRAPAF